MCIVYCFAIELFFVFRSKGAERFVPDYIGVIVPPIWGAIPQNQWGIVVCSQSLDRLRLRRSSSVAIGALNLRCKHVYVACHINIQLMGEIHTSWFGLTLNYEFNVFYVDVLMFLFCFFKDQLTILNAFTAVLWSLWCSGCFFSGICYFLSNHYYATIDRPPILNCILLVTVAVLLYC